MPRNTRKNGKLRLFLDNFFIYGIGGVISKLVPLIMLPLITRLMPDTVYFGVSDLSSTITSVGSSIAILGMYDAMYRMFFEKEDSTYKISICSTTLVFTCITSISVAIILIFLRNQIAQFIFVDSKYAFLVYIAAITTLVSSTNSIVAAPTRMQNKRKVFLVTNTLTPIISYAISVPMILHGHYLIALPIAMLISGFTMEMVFLTLNHKWFKLNYFNKSLLKQMLVIAIPIFPNFLIYWLFNSSDKIMISNILDVASTGVYSIGAKLGHTSQLIYIAFSGGWQFFSFSTMKEKDQVKSNSLIFEYLGVISYILSIYVFVFAQKIYNVLFTGDYVSGYIVAPYLFMAPLMQMLFQIASNQFVIIKKTWPNVLLLLGGAIANVILNLILIPKIGIEGAAIATLCGYIISDIMVCWVLYKMKLMIISRRYIYASYITLLFIIIWRIFVIENVIIGFVLGLTLNLIILSMYKKEIILLVDKFKILKDRNG